MRRGGEEGRDGGRDGGREGGRGDGRGGGRTPTPLPLWSGTKVAVCLVVVTGLLPPQLTSPS